MIEIPSPITRFFTGSTIPLTLASALDPEQRLILANEAFCEMTGYSRGQIEGRNCRFLQGPETETQARREVREAIDQVRDAQILITNYKSDGSKFSNLLFIYSLSDKETGAAFFMGSQFEIVARETTPDALERHATALDEGIARIVRDTRQLEVKTRQLLAETAVTVVRARLHVR